MAPEHNGCSAALARGHDMTASARAAVQRRVFKTHLAQKKGQASSPRAHRRLKKASAREVQYGDVENVAGLGRLGLCELLGNDGKVLN